MLSSALRKFHDRIYVVTTENGRERHANIREQLGSDGIEFVYSVDKTTTSKEQLIAEGVYDEKLAISVDPKDRAMTLGHICCSIGHRRAYQRFLETDAERVLIFEDDVTVLPVSEEQIEKMLAAVPADAECIQWGWNGGRFKPALGSVQQAIFHVKRALGAYKLDHRMIRNLYMRPHNEHFHIASVNFLAHAYTINRKAAKKFIEWNTPINLNADHVLIHAILAGDVRGYVPLTQLFGQRSIDENDPMESLTQKYY